ncbi:MAG: hypothetical protein WB765_20360 [Acidimicrobiales bacterium]
MRQLEEDGVVTRDDQGGYRLTPWGEYLGEPLRALARWGSPLMDEMEETETFRSTWLDFPVAFIFGGTQADRPRAEIEIRADGSPVTMESVQGEVRFRTGSAIAPDLVLTGPPAVVVGILSGRLDKKAAEGLGADVLADFGFLSRLRRTDFLSGPEALEGPRARRKAASSPDK